MATCCASPTACASGLHHGGLPGYFGTLAILSGIVVALSLLAGGASGVEPVSLLVLALLALLRNSRAYAESDARESEIENDSALILRRQAGRLIAEFGAHLRQRAGAGHGGKSPAGRGRAIH